MRIILLLLSLVFSLTSFSQSDSLLFTSLHEPRLAKNPAEPIFSGREHILYHPQIIGIPYFDSASWQKGTVVYQNIVYRDVSMKYDLVADELIVLHVNGYSRVILFTPWVQSFTLGNSSFVYLKADQAPFSNAGIYQELVKGKVSLYAKRSKLIHETTTINDIERSFLNNHSFYILKQGNYHKVKTRKEVMALLKDKKNQVKALLRTAHIRRFRPNRDLAMTRTIEYYNELSR